MPSIHYTRVKTRPDFVTGEQNTQNKSDSGAQSTGKKSRDPLIGTTLDGRFLIEDVLGSGGMSVVYRATQLTVNRQVAIKTMRVQIDETDVQRERFQREVSTLCALNHPNIVTVFDCVIGSEGEPYVVMDYLRGHSLESLIQKEGPLDVSRAIRIAVQVTSALDHAHKHGVIHRDLKPANIVLMDKEMDFVKVVDFGLARLEHETRRLTRSGELWGSPPYVSPEQCMGQPGDERSDIYSLGAVIYEMLTGKDPFYDAGTVYDLLQRHVGTPPPPMAHVNGRVKISAALEETVIKALAKTPRGRFQTAQEFQSALLRASSGAMGKATHEHTRHIAAQATTRPPAELKELLQQGEPTTPSEQFRRALDPMQGEDLKTGNEEKPPGRAPESLHSNEMEQAPPKSATASTDPTASARKPFKLDFWSTLTIGATIAVICLTLLWPYIQMIFSGKDPTTLIFPAGTGTPTSTMPAQPARTTTSETGEELPAADTGGKKPSTLNRDSKTDTAPEPVKDPVIAPVMKPVEKAPQRKPQSRPPASRPDRHAAASTARPAVQSALPKQSSGKDPWSVLKKMKDD